MSGPVSTGNGMGDHVWVYFPVWDIYLGMSPASHPGQLSLAIPSWVGAMSTSRRAVMPCFWGVKAGIGRVWVAGKTVSSLVTLGSYLSTLEIKGLYIN